MTQFNNMSVEQIIARIESHKSDGDDAVREICICLVELKRRKIAHPLHKNPVYRWYEVIASDKLHPGVAVLFNGNPRYLEHVVGRPLDVQKGIVSGREYDVVFAKGTEIKSERKSAIKMSLSMFQRLFPIGKHPASLSEQRAALEVEIEAKPCTHIRRDPIVRADASSRVLFVGKHSIPLSVVKAALAEIGLTVTGEDYDDQQEGAV